MKNSSNTYRDKLLCKVFQMTEDEAVLLLKRIESKSKSDYSSSSNKDLACSSDIPLISS